MRSLYTGKSINHRVSRAQLETTFPCTGRFQINFRWELKCAMHTSQITLQGCVGSGRALIQNGKLL